MTELFDVEVTEEGRTDRLEITSGSLRAAGQEALQFAAERLLDRARTGMATRELKLRVTPQGNGEYREIVASLLLHGA